MRLFPSLLSALGVLLGAAGVALVVSFQPEPVPALIRPSAEVRRAPDAESEGSFAMRGGPWRRPVVEVVTPVVEAAPEPPPPAAPPPRVQGALAFLGRVTTEDQVARFFFKERATGLVVGLAPGETKNGWTLKEINETMYVLEGSGGLYEVAR